MASVQFCWIGSTPPDTPPEHTSTCVLPDLQPLLGLFSGNPSLPYPNARAHTHTHTHTQSARLGPGDIAVNKTKYPPTWNLASGKGEKVLDNSQINTVSGGDCSFKNKAGKRR